MGSYNANGFRGKELLRFREMKRASPNTLRSGAGCEPIARLIQRPVEQLAWAFHGRAYEGSCHAIAGRRAAAYDSISWIQYYNWLNEQQ
jgi:hypothetical protein